MTDFRPGGFQRLPLVVKNLIIINALMLLATMALERFGIDLSDYLGLHYWKSHYFKPWQFITHMFMHGDFMHLFFNMFALWMFGTILENVWGPKRFLTFYLVCGLGAAVLHLGVVAYEFHTIEQAFVKYQDNPTLDQFNLFIKQHYKPGASREIVSMLQRTLEIWNNNPSDISMPQSSIGALHEYLSGTIDAGIYYQGIYDEATVGASGAIFGILFGFGYLFPNTLLYMYFLVPLKAKYFVAGYAIIELYLGIRNSAGDNVAHFAHLGGMVVAFILLKIWNKTNRKHFY